VIALINFFIIAHVMGQKSVTYAPKTLLFLPKDDLSKTKKNRLSENIIPSQLGEVVISKPFSLSRASTKARLTKSKNRLNEVRQMNYSANIAPDLAAKMLMSTGNYMSVEPKLNFTVLYLPNDPLTDSLQSASFGRYKQLQLEKQNLYDAWGISKGDTNVVIGIVDTGIWFDHDDLKNYATNEDDPIDGENNDGDMFGDSSLIDNYRGWDLADWDNDPTVGGDNHGVGVTGCASALVDNGIGGAGTGFNCRYLPIKVSPDDQPGYVTHGYEGIIYAAENGADVINLSWGIPVGTTDFPILQSIIDYAAIDHDAVLVAAAGNTVTNDLYIPASLDNVLSVTGHRYVEDKLAGCYNMFVDVSAQSVAVLTTLTESSSDYGTQTGTSYAAPVVSGIAGLVRAHRPELNALQVAELIRVSGDINDTFPKNLAYKGLMGRRANALKALTDTSSSSIRISKRVAETRSGILQSGKDTMVVRCTFKSFLARANDVRVKINCLTDGFTVVQDSFFIASLGTLDTINNRSYPFLVIKESLTKHYGDIAFKVEYEASNYHDSEHFLIFQRPDMIIEKTGLVAFGNEKLTTCSGSSLRGGDLIGLGMEFFNFSDLIPDCKVRIEDIDGNFKTLSDTFSLNFHSDFSSVSNFESPFKLVLSKNFVPGDMFSFRLVFSNRNGKLFDQVSSFRIDSVPLLEIPLDIHLNSIEYLADGSELSLSGDEVNLSFNFNNMGCPIDTLNVALKKEKGPADLLNNSLVLTDIIEDRKEVLYEDGFSFYLHDNASVGDSVYLSLIFSDKEDENIFDILFMPGISKVILLDGERIEQSSKISVYPNIFDDIIKIRGLSGWVHFKLLDLLGKVHFNEAIFCDSNAPLDLEISQLPSGSMYNLIIDGGFGSRSFKLFKK